MKDLMFSGKTVFVSGGTGYIGSEICRAFGKYGARVIFSYSKNQGKAEALKKELKNSQCIKIDLANVPELNKKLNKVSREEKNIDILVNNAGISRIMPLAMLEKEDVDTVMDINIRGTIFVTKAIIKNMIRNRRGAIVNIGSIAGHRILDVPVTYAMSKAAMFGFTLSLAGEMRKFGIRVNMVIPGMMEGGVASGIPAELKKEFLDHCLTGRAGKAIEVAETVCFLASDKASYINGQNIFVDGGI
ncbi:MAG: SDR family oxidoreductase [bacterium]|nr:SDR family oxidoreductase [bacterium]